jgi:hypothetical protein
MCHQDFLFYHSVDSEEATKLDAIDHRSSSLFLGKGWDISPWNKVIFAGLAQDVLEENQRNVPRCDRVDAQFLVAEFWARLRTSRAVWSRARPRAGETSVQARERVIRENEEKNIKQKMNARKATVSGAFNNFLHKH